MRLWSLHPKFLDAKGLVALWREGLLAKHVLEGKTIGYRNHPQLDRFKRCRNPVEAINAYLFHVYIEAKKRGYNFNSSKIKQFEVPKISVTIGQVEYEWEHLIKKLKVRDLMKFEEVVSLERVIHPIFYSVEGDVESFERVG